MKRVLHPILALLLGFALLAPLSGPALAAVDPRSVTLTTTNDTIYILSSNRSTSVEITATASPSSFDGTIYWSVQSGANLIDDDGSFEEYLKYNTNSRTVTLTAAGSRTGTAVIRATLDSVNERVYRDITVYVEKDTVKSFSASLSRTSIDVGQTAEMVVTASLESGRTVQDSDVSYSSSNTSVARVSSYGIVTGVSAGTARITAELGDRSVTKTITVTGGGATDTAPLGSEYSLRKVYSELLAYYAASYSTTDTVAYPDDDASVTFSIPSSSDTFGAIRDSAGREVLSGYSVRFRELQDMVLETYAEGDYTFICTLSDNGDTVREEFIIRVEAPVRNVRVAIDGSNNYSFRDTDNSGKTGEKLLNDAIGTTYGSIRFGELLSGEDTGTLYTSSNMGPNNRVTERTVVEAVDVGSLYFSPSRAGTFRMEYEAFANREGRGVSLASGELIIAVDSASLDVTINLDSTDPYTFSHSTANGRESAASQLTTAINDAIGRYSWSYVRFEQANSANAVGVLHEEYSVRREIASTDAIAASDLRYLYFVPSRTGTLEMNYGAYADSSSKTPLVTGKLRIVVSSIPTTSADIVYTITAKQSISLSEDDFIRFYQNKEGSRYSLAYVVFNDYNGDGQFSHNGVAFKPYNSADYYTRDFTGTRSSSPRYLDSITFTAPKAAGFTAVKFTCHGGTSTDRSNVEHSGVLYIFYTSEELPAITYNAYGSGEAVFAEQDFVEVYRKAVNTNTANPQFSIRLLTAPYYGTLYRSPNGSSSSTRLTQSNISDYTFTVNGTSSRESVNTLSYAPYNTTASGTDDIVYIVYDNKDVQLYSGIIRFKLAPDRTITAGSEGYLFTLADFIVSNDRDPIRTIQFRKPESGKFYVVQDGKITAAEEKTRFYTLSTAEGTYPISALRYVPRYGQSGTVSLTYVATRNSGASGEVTLNVSITDKQTSSVFADVSGWATSSVDFANTLGLVGGMGGNPPQFAPNQTMRRQDLVLILYRLAGQPSVSGSFPYTDIPSNAYYQDSAVWAYRNDIMEGVMTGTRYDPTGAVTRQDFAQILYNYTRAIGGDISASASLSRYSDADNVGSSTLDGVTWAVANGYITSTTAGYTIEPARTATRAEIVTLLHRYLTY